MHTVRAHQGETLDQLCYRVFGSTADITERALRLNPGLAELGPKLPEGTPILLPDAEPTTHRLDTVQLWT
ncbi:MULTISPECIES: tail protein X [Halomonas]|uniref:tail protein X n=1 Tax=Halomonas TaxID=2745 RepID=UPI001C964388|nr:MULTISPECIES: tail protein X [Halomonas]MBY6206880.1 tail protein X [Halomonas sp. DP3Y7-2]MBY6230354.1 tail protein X [Halomonas sp. DP3Y7-1]MCA0918515.1 tail protein X [Halomonas denitrificans]